MRNLSEAQNLADLVAYLKEEQGDSDASLGEKIGLGAATIYRLRTGGQADDESLRKLAAYSGLRYEWILRLAKGLHADSGHSPLVTVVADLLEQLPADIQEAFL